MNDKSAVHEWTIDEVGLWLKRNNLSEYISLLCEKHKIDGTVLLSITEDDLRNPPVQISVLGKCIYWDDITPASIYLLKVHNRNTKTICEI